MTKINESVNQEKKVRAIKVVSVNQEKKVRAIKVVKKEDFLKVIAQAVEIVTDDDFESRICEKTANGLFKLSVTMPQDMTGVKSFDKDGLKWYQIPTTDYKTAFSSYISYRLTCESKAKANLQKQFASLSVEDMQKVLAMLAK